MKLRDGLLKYQKHYQALLDEKAKVIENIDKKFAIRQMEEDDNQKEAIEVQKQERVQEAEHKFNEVIEMLVQSYSDNM